LTEQCIRGWFEDARIFFKQNNIEYVLLDAKRQFNGDETGFQLDPKCGRVLAPHGKILYTEAGGLKEQVTVLVTTRADGELMKSVIIFPYKRAVPQIVNNVPDEFAVGRSESGWMTSDIFFEYLANVFISYLAEERRKEKGLNPEQEQVLDDSDWVVYWIVGYKSHLTMHTSQLCEVNKVALYCFKAHASHVCQPNDLGPFKPLKAEWKSAVSEWRICSPYETLTCAHFAPVLKKAVDILSKQSIVSGNRVAGLYPFNENAVHYDWLTATNQKKFDSSAFLTVTNGACSSETHEQITLKNVKRLLGEDVVSTYQRLFHLPVVDEVHLPPVNMYLLWRQLKLNASQIPTSEQQQQACTEQLLICLPSQIMMAEQQQQTFTEQEPSFSTSQIPMAEQLSCTLSQMPTAEQQQQTFTEQLVSCMPSQMATAEQQQPIVTKQFLSCMPSQIPMADQVSYTSSQMPTTEQQQPTFTEQLLSCMPSQIPMAEKLSCTLSQISTTEQQQPTFTEQLSWCMQSQIPMAERVSYTSSHMPTTEQQHSLNCSWLKSMIKMMLKLLVA